MRHNTRRIPAEYRATRPSGHPTCHRGLGPVPLVFDANLRLSHRHGQRARREGKKERRSTTKYGTLRRHPKFYLRRRKGLAWNLNPTTRTEKHARTFRTSLSIYAAHAAPRCAARRSSCSRCRSSLCLAHRRTPQHRNVVPESTTPCADPARPNSRRAITLPAFASRRDPSSTAILPYGSLLHPKVKLQY